MQQLCAFYDPVIPDQADGDTALIFVSGNDPALALALFGSQSVFDWAPNSPAEY
jgi:hypothetical protein